MQFGMVTNLVQRQQLLVVEKTRRLLVVRYAQSNRIEIPTPVTTV